MYRKRKWNVDCQGLQEERNGELWFDGSSVEDEKILEMECGDGCITVNAIEPYTYKW